MRIGMLLLSRFPPDIRVEKEIETLKLNHEISLLCPRRRGQMRTESRDGLEIFRVFSTIERQWHHWNLIRTCDSRAWTNAIGRFVESQKIEALHVHDLPLLGPASKVSHAYDIPIVADLHENYPAMLAEERRSPLREAASLGGIAYRLFLTPDRWRKYEVTALQHADQIITVIDEARDRVVALGVEPQKVHVVGNYSVSVGGEMKRERLVENAPSNTFTVLYAGGFGVTRDLLTVIKSVALLPTARYPNIRVLLVGGKGRSLKRLQTFARTLGVTDRVEILPWLPLDEAEALMTRAHVGLVPHAKSPHTDSTIPHKLFQYMCRRLPVIVSDCAPLRRIVRESKCGLVYPSGSAELLADCIAKLFTDRELSVQLGEAGHQAVATRYNWAMAGQSLLDVYRYLPDHHGGR